MALHLVVMLALRMVVRSAVRRDWRLVDLLGKLMVACLV